MSSQQTAAEARLRAKAMVWPLHMRSELATGRAGSRQSRQGLVERKALGGGGFLYCISHTRPILQLPKYYSSGKNQQEFTAAVLQPGARQLQERGSDRGGVCRNR